jgi:hypothetical protein
MDTPQSGVMFMWHNHESRIMPLSKVDLLQGTVRDVFRGKTDLRQ